jgi:toxin HigB-1
VIKSFRDKGLQRFFESGAKSGIRPDHAAKLQKQLAVLDSARSTADLPTAWRPHSLTGQGPAGKDLDGHYGIWVSGNWRLTFVFKGSDVHLLDYLDYH